MQVLGIKFYNFFRFGEENNSVVFDITEADRMRLQDGSLTLGDLYEELKQDASGYLQKIKDGGGFVDLLAIAGVRGENFDKSNGVGKSSIFEGICYAHYDKIVRKNVNTDKIEKAGLSVVTRFNGSYPKGLRESYVEEIFIEQGKIYRIKRGRTFTDSQKSNTPLVEFERIDGGEIDSQAGHRTRDTNEAIEFVTSMDYDLFVNSAMFGQSDAGKFLTGTDKTRKEMMISLLRLEAIVRSCLENTRERKNELVKNIEKLSTQLALLDEGLKSKPPIEECEKKIDFIKQSIKKFDNDIVRYTKTIETLSKESVIKEEQSLRDDIPKVKVNLDGQREQKKTQVKEWEKLCQDAELKIEVSVAKKSDIYAKAQSLKADFAKKQKVVSEFDEKMVGEILKKSIEASQNKPKYEEAIKKFINDKEKLIEIVTKEKTERERLASENNSLNAQFSSGEDKFVCDKCKSVVSRSHIENEIKRNQEKIKEYDIKIKKIQEEQSQVQEKLTRCNEAIVKIVEWEKKGFDAKTATYEHDAAQKDLAQSEKTKADYQRDYKEVLDEKKDLQSKKAEYLQKIEEISKKYDVQIKEFETQLLILQKKLEEAQQASEGVQKRINDARTAKDAISNQKSSANSETGSLQKEIETIKADTKRIEDLTKTHASQNRVLSRLIYIEDAYGLEGIQTRIVKKYLPLLNVYIKETLDILSDGDMLVEMIINNHSKVDMKIKGGTADTFALLSGGEKTLVRLAVDVGLTRLSFSRVSQKPEIICLDEIFGSLDPHNRKNVFRLINKLRKDFSRIVLISHSPEINDKISHKILIEKGEGDHGRSEINGVT